MLFDSGVPACLFTRFPPFFMQNLLGDIQTAALFIVLSSPSLTDITLTFPHLTDHQKPNSTKFHCIVIFSIFFFIAFTQNAIVYNVNLQMNLQHGRTSRVGACVCMCHVHYMDVQVFSDYILTMCIYTQDYVLYYTLH